jgi:ferredoxin
MVSKVNLIYFSPTGTTREVVAMVGEGLGSRASEQYDLTRTEQDFSPCLSDGIAVIGVPVYAGRVPELFLKRIDKLSGGGAPAVVVVLYGNRAYEDALVELRDVIAAKGFTVVAAGAFIGEHSFSTEKQPVAVDRPDREDLQSARAFGAAIALKLRGDSPPITLTIPGNTPYKERVALSGICPETNPALCTLCKVCADLCPVSIITVNQEVITNADLCILCCACVKGCPHAARQMRHPMVETRREMLAKNCNARKEPSCFL